MTPIFQHVDDGKLSKKQFFFSIRPSLGLLPVLGLRERYMKLTLDVALLDSSRAGADLG